MGFSGLRRTVGVVSVAVVVVLSALGGIGVFAGGGAPESEPDDGRVDGDEFDIEVTEALGERVGIERISSPLGVDADKLLSSSVGDGGFVGTFGLGIVGEAEVPRAS